MVTWDPALYARSSVPQLAWAREVIGRLRLSGNEHILDIGCGEGKVSAEFLSHLPSGSVTGIDSSPEMIRFAREAYPPDRYPTLSFVEMDARMIEWDERFDLVFSNACLHWIEDQRSVLAGVRRALLPGGRLIVSCGGKGNAEDVMQAVWTVTGRPSWASRFRDFRVPYFFYSADEYAPWVEEAGLVPEFVRLVPKDMVHEDREDFVSWFRSTFMPYTERVPEDRREEFIEEVVGEYLAANPVDESGVTHVKMVRLEVEAVKK